MTVEFDDETVRIISELAARTGQTFAEAVRTALAERLERELSRRRAGLGLADRLAEIGRHCAAMPDHDARSPDDIVGYDETGMWS
jgi:antitoxin VapB